MRRLTWFTGLLSLLLSVGCQRWARPLAGTSARALMVGGVQRQYLLHAGRARPARALVLVLHGLAGTAAAIEQRTKGTFDRLAEQDGAVVVYPLARGEPRRWNDGWYGPAPVDDLTFLAALIDAVATEFNIDRGRVYAAGLSNGAAMVYRLACQRPDLVAAVAPISGGMPPDIMRSCAQGPPVSIIGMHGTEDPIVPLDRSIGDGIATWTRRDGCPAVARISAVPDGDPGDGTTTHAALFEPCAAGTAVAFYTIEGGGHAWPGGESVWGFVRRGRTPRDFDAGVLIWDFFLRHPRR